MTWEEELNEQRKSISTQLFQLAYFGKIPPEWASSLEINERNYIYKQLTEQLDKENKKAEEEERKAKSGSHTPHIPHIPRR
jgi:hypothetical protein